MEYLNAFLCGGILCAVGQIIIDKTQLTPARILTGYVVVGVLLSALGLYEPLAQWGGAGATVPLTGFGHTLAKGVREAVASDGWIGIFTGGLTAAAGGVTAAVVAGVLIIVSAIVTGIISNLRKHIIAKTIFSSTAVAVTNLSDRW
ncbi:MAG: SpoVA/SpoVAEb family sporulation membrane protein, partial [Oscillibacter sp.]|nr:SpoVA/SpoVAEb family sporulation membrane protein [Oscillibacter sp.]